MVFDLLPDLFGNCFGIDFGLLYCFGFNSVFSFGLCLVSLLSLVFVSSYVYFVSVFVFTSALVSFLISIFYCGFDWFRLVSILFSCCFVCDFIIPFQRFSFRLMCYGFWLTHVFGFVSYSDPFRIEIRGGEGKDNLSMGSGELFDIIQASWG